jgi:hypothetical protein
LNTLREISGTARRAEAEPSPTPAEWADLLFLVKDVRKLQRIYRRTIDPVIRRELRKLELDLDDTVARLEEQLEADAAAHASSGIPAEADQAVTVKGGVA